MRAVVITKHGPPSVLQIQERPDPKPAAGEVVIDVKAAGVNFADVMARLGFYADAPKTPCVVGYEVAGTVSELGADVEGVAVGDRVVGGTRFGGYAERVAVAANELVTIPPDFSFEQAAAVPVNYSTAWAGLVRYGSLQRGERVLIHAAGGGVGIAATQLAKSLGAEIYGTASASKHARILENGVDHALDYNKAGWENNLPGLDLVMDAVGGKSFRTSYNLLRPGGRMVCYGASSVVAGNRRNFLQAGKTVLQMPRFNLIKQMQVSKTVIGLNMLHLWDEFGSLQPWLEPLTEMLNDGTIKPVVAEAFSFENAPDAHRMIAERRNVGKVVLVP